MPAMRLRRRRSVPPWGAVLVLVVAVTAGCGDTADPADRSDGSGAGSRPERLRIATTVAPITSIVANVVGEHADVTGIVPEGTDSHTFEPKPSAAELLATADLVFVNGLQLEEPTVELADAHLAEGAEVVELGTRTLPEEEWIYDRSFPESEGRPNPHLWTNPRLAREYARIVAAEVSDRDPAHAADYAANLTAFEALVDELDAAMRESFATIPRRQLLTYHDAYAYFAEDYGWEVVGAIQVSDFEDPTPREVADLIDQVRAARLPAIFGSEVFPSPVLAQIAAESGADYVDDLRDDDLPGEPGDPDHSWLGLMLFDYITMTEALGGDATALRAVEVRDVAPDGARYPR